MQNLKLQVKNIIITENQAEQRLDNFLFKHLKGVPKSHIYQIIRKGEIRINKKRAKPSYHLQIGDNVRIPPVKTSVKKPTKPSQPIINLLKNKILYEDNKVIVLNKPSGIAVHSGNSISFGIIETLRYMYPKLKFLELVHRLDRDTSGCLLLAKKRSVLKALHEQLRNNQIEKTYLALIRGHWKGGKHLVDASLLKNILKSGERIIKISEQGKKALTEFKPLKKFPNTSLMEIKLLTGRTHQIRVHAAYLGCPIAGDSKYGDKQFNKEMRAKGLKRLFLHAYSLKFKMPETGKMFYIKADLENELKNFFFG